MSVKLTYNIGVLGAGSFGTSLAIALAKNGNNIKLWGHKKQHIEQLDKDRENKQYLPGIKFPKNLSVEHELYQVCQDADALLIVVPSSAFASTLESLKEIIYQNPSIKHITWATKGLDPEKQVFLSEIIEQILPDFKSIAYITGPSFADELAKGLPTILTVASEQDKTAEAVNQWFSGSTIRTYPAHDLVSAQIGASIKNIMAIATGISDGLQLGANARSGLITRGLAEMIRFSQHLGCPNCEQTLIGPAGLGDLVLTATDDKSRNRKVGLMLGQGMKIDEIKTSLGQVAEGVITTKTVYNIAQREDIYMPITQAVYHVLYNDLVPQKAVQMLIEGPSKAIEELE